MGTERRRGSVSGCQAVKSGYDEGVARPPGRRRARCSPTWAAAGVPGFGVATGVAGCAQAGLAS
jgi:hypothetical protein